MQLNRCATICNANLKRDLMSSFTIIDQVLVTDAQCNSLVFMTDEKGLNDISAPLSGPWISKTDRRTRTVASLAEVASHYSPSSEVYIMAKQYFANVGQRGVAPYFTLGYWDRAGGEAISTALDAINNCNPCFSRVGIVHRNTAGEKIYDTPITLALLDWCQTNEKSGYVVSNDEGTENTSNTTNTAAQAAALGLSDQYVQYVKGTCRVVTDPVTGETLFWADGETVLDEDGNPIEDTTQAGFQDLISDGTEPMLERFIPYTEILAAGWQSNVDLSQSGSGYNLAYKPMGGAGFVGIPADAIDNSVVTSVTGKNPDNTLNPNNNGYANVYVQTQGLTGLFPGVSVTGVRMNKVHLRKYLRSQLAQAQANLFANSRRVEFDDARGASKVQSAAGRVMAAAQEAGHFTNDAQPWELSGTYARKGLGWVMRQDSFADQTAARKTAGTAPVLKICYVEAGGTDHVPFELCTLAAAPSV